MTCWSYGDATVLRPWNSSQGCSRLYQHNRAHWARVPAPAVTITAIWAAISPPIRAPSPRGMHGAVLSCNRAGGARRMTLGRGGAPAGPASPRSAVDGIFLVGMSGSGVELLGDALSRLGLRALDGTDAAHPQGLAALNQRLLASAGNPPIPAPFEVARILGEPQVFSEAQRRFTTLQGRKGGRVMEALGYGRIGA